MLLFSINWSRITYNYFRVLVIRHGVWIDYWIYGRLITCDDYANTNYRSQFFIVFTSGCLFTAPNNGDSPLTSSYPYRILPGANNRWLLAASNSYFRLTESTSWRSLHSLSTDRIENTASYNFSVAWLFVMAKRRLLCRCQAVDMLCESAIPASIRHVWRHKMWWCTLNNKHTRCSDTLSSYGGNLILVITGHYWRAFAFSSIVSY
jgi:hypothetical protein